MGIAPCALPFVVSERAPVSGSRYPDVPCRGGRYEEYENILPVIGIWRLKEAGGETDYRVKEAMHKERLVARWLTATTANSIRTVALTKSADPKAQDYYRKTIGVTSKEIAEIQKSIDQMKKERTELQLLVNMAAAATLSLQDQANQLVSAVNTFRPTLSRPVYGGLSHEG